MTGKTFQASPSQSHWLNYNWRSLHADKWIVDFSFKKVNFFFFTFCYTIVNLYFFCFWKPKRCILWDYSHWLSSWNMRGKLISLGSFIYSFFFSGLGDEKRSVWMALPWTPGKWFESNPNTDNNLCMWGRRICVGTL